VSSGLAPSGLLRHWRFIAPCRRSSRRFAHPERYWAKGLEAHGFHASLRVSDGGAARLDPVGLHDVILAHLGNGASLPPCDMAQASTPAWASLPHSCPLMRHPTEDLDPGARILLERAECG